VRKNIFFTLNANILQYLAIFVVSKILFIHFCTCLAQDPIIGYAKKKGFIQEICNRMAILVFIDAKKALVLQ